MASASGGKAPPPSGNVELARRMETGDQEARAILILAHMPLVCSIARRICRVYGCWELYPDLVQEGAIALIRAVDKFDYRRGVRLATFAYPRIEGAMLRFLGKERRFRQRVKSLDELAEATPEDGEAAYEPVDESPPPDEVVTSRLSAQGMRRRLAIVLRDMPADTRLRKTKVVGLRLKGWSEQEIAHQLGVPLNTVKSDLHRVREAYYKRWGGEFDGDQATR